MESIEDNAQFDGLCSRCTTLKVNELLEGSWRSDAQKVIDIGSPLQDFVTTCPLCQLFIQSCRHLNVSSMLSPEASLWRVPHWHYRPSGPTFSRDWYFYLEVRIERQVRPLMQRSLHRDLTGQAIVPLSTDRSAKRFEEPDEFDEFAELDESSFMARKLSPVLRNFNTVRTWIRQCRDHHKSDCPSPQAALWPGQLKLIHCATRKIVETIGRPPYAALSYLWGGTTIDDGWRTERNCLPDQAPLVVEDAIYAAQKCGIEYVWIDRYCIDQTDPSQTQLQIMQMDRIFRAAYLTLVDAANSDPLQGLYGVSKLRRKHQYTTRVGGTDLTIIDMDIDDGHWRRIEDSPWSTRGWTFQEDFFSCRKLFFTSEQLYWSCQEGRESETYLPFSPRPKNSPLRPYRFGESSLHPDRFGGPVILELLADYTQRNLTYQSDVVRAFEGIFQFYRSLENPSYHHFGVPVPSRTQWGQTFYVASEDATQSARLAVGLCWIAKSACCRRQEFPSWTWAGWQTAIDYTGSKAWPRTAFLKHSSTSKSETKIMLEDSEGILIDFDTFDLKKLGSDGPHLSRYIWIESLVVPIIAYQQDHPFISKVMSFYSSVGKHESRFWTTCEDEFRLLLVQLELYDCDATTGRSAHRSEIKHTGHPLLGVMLERGINQGLRESKNMLVILVQCAGDHYQRVGHASFSPATTYAIPKGAEGPLRPESLSGCCEQFPWELCFQHARRLSIRLG